MINATIASYGKKLGFNNLQFNNNHVVKLQIEKLGDLFLEDTPPNLCIYVAREFDKVDFKILTKALFLCHYKQKNPFTVFIGLQGENKLVFFIRLPHENTTEINIEKTIELLHRLHTQISQIEY